MKKLKKMPVLMQEPKGEELMEYYDDRFYLWISDVGGIRKAATELSGMGQYYDKLSSDDKEELPLDFFSKMPWLAKDEILRWLLEEQWPHKYCANDYGITSLSRGFGDLRSDKMKEILERPVNAGFDSGRLVTEDYFERSELFMSFIRCGLIQIEPRDVKFWPRQSVEIGGFTKLYKAFTADTPVMWFESVGEELEAILRRANIGISTRSGVRDLRNNVSFVLQILSGKHERYRIFGVEFADADTIAVRCIKRSRDADWGEGDGNGNDEAFCRFIERCPRFSIYLDFSSIDKMTLRLLEQSGGCEKRAETVYKRALNPLDEEMRVVLAMADTIMCEFEILRAYAINEGSGKMGFAPSELACFMLMDVYSGIDYDAL